MDSALSPVPLVFKPKPVQLSLALDLSVQPIGFLTPAKPWRLPDDIEGKIARAERPLSQVKRKWMPVCMSWRARHQDFHVEPVGPVGVRVIGGRALPPFRGTNGDCTIDWKVSPMRRLRKKVLRRLQSRGGHGPRPEPVVLLGTRYDESAVRSQNMRERGGSDIDIAHRFQAAMEAI